MSISSKRKDKILKEEKFRLIAQQQAEEKIRKEEKCAIEKYKNTLDNLQREANEYNRKIINSLMVYQNIKQIPESFTIESIGASIGEEIIDPSSYIHPKIVKSDGLLYTGIRTIKTIFKFIPLFIVTLFFLAILTFIILAILNKTDLDQAIFNNIILIVLLLSITIPISYLYSTRDKRTPEEKQKEYETAKEKKSLEVKELYELAKGVLDGNSESMKKILDIQFNNFPWHRLMPIICTSLISANGLSGIININFPSKNNMPKLTAVVDKQSMNTKLISTKNDKQLHGEYLVYIYGALLMVASICMNSLPTLENVICNGYTDYLDESTGVIQKVCVLSVDFDKSTWSKLNPANARPDKFITNFTYRAKNSGVIPLSENAV